MELIEYHDVGIRYKMESPVVEHLNLKFKSGTVTALLGPNGSGKTTLLSALNRLLKPYCGSVFIEGENIDNISQKALAKKIATVPQFSSPNFSFTVYNMILWGRAPHISYTPKAEDYAIVAETIERLKINHLRDKVFTELSGGEKQMALVARAIAQKSSVILMDEPTTYLDINNQIRILNLVKEINTNDGVTFIITFHEPNHALYLADQVVMVNNGTARQGSVSEMMTKENIQSLYGVNSAFLNLFDMSYLAIDYRS